MYFKERIVLIVLFCHTIGAYYRQFLESGKECNKRKLKFMSLKLLSFFFRLVWKPEIKLK